MIAACLRGGSLEPAESLSDFRSAAVSVVNGFRQRPTTLSPNKKGDPFGPPSKRIVKWFLDAFDVFCLPALGAFDYVELNLLSFLQAAETVA